jgi:hypothetical protein
MGFLLIVVVAMAALWVFTLLSRLAAEGNEGARFNAILEVLALLFAAGVGLLAAFVLLALGCDESCRAAPASEWWHTDYAWQWWAQFLAAAAGTLAILAALISTVRRRHDRAPAWLVAAAVCFAAWAVILAPLGDRLGI